MYKLQVKTKVRAAPGALRVPMAPVPTTRLSAALEPPHVAWATTPASWCRAAPAAPHVPAAPTSRLRAALGLPRVV
jgi:hypothetical protein